MKEEILFADFVGTILRKEERERQKKIEKKEELRIEALLQRQRFNSLHPMAKRVILSLIKVLKKKGRLYSLQKGCVELCYSNGWPNDHKNRLLTIKENGSFFTILSYSACEGVKTKNLSEKSLVAALRNAGFVKDALAIG